MYELLTPAEKSEFENTVEPVFKRNTPIHGSKEQPFKVHVGKINRHITEESLILSGIYVEYNSLIIIKSLISEAKGREKHELGAYLIFCSLLVTKFIDLVKERLLKSLLIHTNDNTMLEALLDHGFIINKSKNNFYKAFKKINEEIENTNNTI